MFVDDSCDAIIDMVFLFDESGSIASNATNFVEMKNFMINIVNAFDPVGPTGAQFAALCFATDVKDHFFLNQHDSAQEVEDAITGFSVGAGGSTAIGKGLRVRRYLNEMMFLSY